MPIIGSRANASALGFGLTSGFDQGPPGYLWVAAGANGALYTSSSLTGVSGSWSSRNAGFGTSAIFTVDSNSNGLFVAAGESGKLATSTDGINWTQRTSSFGTSAIYHVAYGNGTWVAVGQSGKLATSPDGTTWTQRTTGFSSAANVNSVAYGGFYWVAGDSTGALRATFTPTGTWTAYTSTLSSIERIYYAPNQAIWVAGADTGTASVLASSTNATTWTARSSAVNIGASGMVSFASTSAGIVATSQGTITTSTQRSTTGTTWSGVNINSVDPTQLFICESDDLGTILAMPYATGTATNSFTTANAGSNWTDRGSVPFKPYALCHSAGKPAIR